MKANELKQWVIDNDIEYHFDGEEVILMPFISQLESFIDLLTPGIFDDGGILCSLKDGYLCIFMTRICNYYGIEISDIFKK